MTRPENQLIYEAINKPVPSLPTIEGIRCAKDTLEALQDLITPYYRVSRAYQSFKDTFHNALYDWFDDELRRRFNSRS